jgi:hypothetical protein
LLKYIKTTRDFALVYTCTKVNSLTGYSDADYAGSMDDRKSTSGYVFKYGECVISWKSGKQKTVSLSSTEAEYISLVTAVTQSIWLRQLLKELNRDIHQIKVYCDNISTICLAKNPEFHSRTKHIDVRHHFIREVVKEKLVKLEYKSTDEMVADVLTKGLSNNKHWKAMEMLKLKN